MAEPRPTRPDPVTSDPTDDDLLTAEEVEGVHVPEDKGEDEEMQLYSNVRLQITFALIALEGIQSEKKSSNSREEQIRDLMRFFSYARMMLEKFAMQADATSTMYTLAHSEYMLLVEQVEYTLLDLEDQEQSGVHEKIDLRNWSETGTQASALSAMDRTIELHNPLWVIHYLSTFIDDKKKVALARNDRDLDKAYEDAILQRPPKRTRAMQEIAQALLLRAGMSLPHAAAEGDDIYSSNLHRAVNALSWAEEDWEGRGQGAIAEKYAALQSGVERITRLIAEQYVGTLVPRSAESAVSFGDGDPKLEGPRATEKQLQTAIDRRRAQAEYLISNIHTRHGDAQAVKAFGRLLSKLLDGTAALFGRIAGMEQYDEEWLVEAEYHYISQLSKIEDMINFMDELEEGNTRMSFDPVQYEDLHRIPSQEADVYTITEEEGASLSLYAKVLAAHVAFNTRIHEKPAIRSTGDALYTGGMMDESTMQTDARAMLRRGFIDMLYNGAIESIGNNHNAEGSINRARNAIVELHALWSKRFPPVAEKYSSLLLQFDELIRTIQIAIIHRQAMFSPNPPE